jgi:c(7)-type cytochrome triheme protein
LIFSKMKKKCLLIILLAFFCIANVDVSGKSSFSDGGGILYTESVKAVLFSHKKHVDVKHLSCDKCHNGLFEMEALRAEEKNDFNMESLYQGKYCGACHNGKVAFASGTRCASCHVRFADVDPGYVRGKAPKAGRAVYKTIVVMGKGKEEVLFQHETHTSSAKCRDCHSAPFQIKKGSNRITLREHPTKKYCFGCHDGKQSFSWNNCHRCHQNLGVYALAAPLSKESGKSKNKCLDCHASDSKMKDLVKPPLLGGEGEG